MKIPTSLKHKPVMIAADYDRVDGRYAGNTDAKGLSLGLAQWNDRGKVEISAKVWRHTGDKWSRQSEELPLHRVLDLALLVCRTKAFMTEAYRRKDIYDPQDPRVDRLPLQGGAFDLSVCTDNPMIDEDIKLFRQCLADDDEMISERLHILARLLREMGY